MAAKKKKGPPHDRLERLTIMEENYCQAYILSSNKSEAYRSAYSTSNMKPNTVNRKASLIYSRDHVRARIEQLKAEMEERNKITVDEIIKRLANIVRFDIAEIFDENNNLKPIKEISPDMREAIEELQIMEEFEQIGKKKVFKGYSKKIKAAGKLAAIEKLLRYFGSYEKDNEQSKPTVTTIINLGEGKDPNEITT